MFGSKQKKRERQQKIKQLFTQAYPGTLSVPELAQLLNVPNSTIIRDLPDLEDQEFYLEEINNRLRWRKNFKYDQ